MKWNNRFSEKFLTRRIPHICGYVKCDDLRFSRILYHFASGRSFIKNPDKIRSLALKRYKTREVLHFKDLSVHLVPLEKKVRRSEMISSQKRSITPHLRTPKQNVNFPRRNISINVQAEVEIKRRHAVNNEAGGDKCCLETTTTSSHISTYINRLATCLPRYKN